MLKMLYLPKKNQKTSLNFLPTSLNFALASVLLVTSFHTKAEEMVTQKQNEKLKIVFLIDGFSYDQFEIAHQKGRIPNIKKFFDLTTKKVNKSYGHSSFPSLTFPNISTLLTKTPIDQIPIKGNKVLSKEEEEIKDLESPESSIQIQKMLASYPLFNSSNKKKEYSFSYSFQFGEKVKHLSKLKAGVQYISQDFESLDKETLEYANESFMDFILQKKTPLPEFAFIHLIGLDALNHLKGPGSKESAIYIQKLDSKFKLIFDTIQKLELLYDIEVLMVADHGFMKVEDSIKMKDIAEKSLKSFKAQYPIILEESRLLGLYMNSSWKNDMKKEFFQSISPLKEVLATAYRDETELSIFHRKRLYTFKYKDGINCSPYNFNLNFEGQSYCPQQISEKLGSPLNTSRFWENIALYLHDKNGPNGVIIASDGISFTNKYVGDHGGLTTQEIDIPLLWRGKKVIITKEPEFSVLRALFFQLN